MGGVADFVGDVVGGVVEGVGDVVEGVVDVAGDIVETVGDTVVNTVEAAIDDPVKTIATVAAVATGNAYLIPYINAADVVADGGDLGDAAKAFGTAYVAQGVANYVAADLSAANTFDTTPFTEQTAMLASQNAGLVPYDQLSTAIGSAAGASTGTALAGGDIGDILTSGLGAGAGSYVGQEVRGETADLLGPTGSKIAGNVAGATTSGVIRGQDFNQVLGSSFVNNLINVNLANMNSGAGNQPTEKKTDSNTAYNSLSDIDKQFVDMAVATGTDLDTAVNYAMANPTLETSMQEGVQYADLDTGVRTDAGYGGGEEDTTEGYSQPEFKYGANGEVYERTEDGTYKQMEDFKLDSTGQILTKEGDNWTETGSYAKGTEIMRSGEDERQLTQDELREGYYYASDGSMRTPEGTYFLKIYGTNETSPDVIQAEPGSTLDQAVSKIGGLLGLGGGDPNAAYSALFGGGAYIPGSFDASGSFVPIAWGTKENEQAIQWMDAVLEDPNATDSDKQLARQALNKIRAGEVGGGSGEAVGGGGTTTATGGAPTGASSSYISNTVNSLKSAGYDDSDIATFLSSNLGVDKNQANELILASVDYTGSGTTGTSTGGGGTGGTTGASTGADAGTGGGTGGGTGEGTGGATGDGTGVGTGTGGGSGAGTGAGSGTGGTGTGTGSGGVTGGLTTASQALSYGSRGASSGSSTGALPKSLNPTYLSAAPAEDSTMNLGQLKQLYPQLSGVDPRLLQILTGRSKSGLSADQGGGATSFSGTNLITPSAGFPARASGQSQAGVTAFAPTNDLMNNSYDAMSAAGLRSLGALPSGGSPYGLKGGGKVENRNSAPHIPEFITGKTGHYVDGKGDGQSDDIPAMLADGEYVFDADTVSALGNGSSKAGAQLLDHFRESLREHKRSAPTDKIPPAASPLQYMKEALKRHKG